MQCLRVLHTDAGIGLHGSGRCEGRGRRRDRELRVFVGGGGRGKGKESRRLGGIGGGMSRRLGVAAGLANGHHLREAKPLQPSRFLDGGQSSFRPGPRILHLGIAKLSPMIHFTCYICLPYICWPMGQRSQSMLDPYSIRLVVDRVLAFDGRLFHSSSAIAAAGLYQHQQRPWPPPWPKASRACWTRTPSAKLRRTPAKTF
jgi:hypothetical protein